MYEFYIHVPLMQQIVKKYCQDYLTVNLSIMCHNNDCLAVLLACYEMCHNVTAVTVHRVILLRFGSRNYFLVLVEGTKQEIVLRVQSQRDYAQSLVDNAQRVTNLDSQQDPSTRPGDTSCYFFAIISLLYLNVVIF